MNYSYLKFVLLAVAILLTACQQSPVRFEDSPYTLLPTGTTLIQHQDITLPANAFDVTIQNGIIMSQDGLDWREANCLLETNNRAATSRTLKPGTYQVIRSKRHNEETMLPVSVASLQLVSGGDSSKIIFLTLELKSEQNPFITRMTCTEWSEYFNDRYLSLNQVRATLQPLFSIKLPGEQ